MTRAKTLYYDYNILSYLRNAQYELLQEKHESLNADYMVVFSPAHLEDIAVSEMRENAPIAIVNDEIDFLESVAGRNALRPSSRDRLDLHDESPRDCYRRVIRQYDANALAESIDKDVIEDANRYPGGCPRKVNNVKPEDILDKLIYREAIALDLIHSGLIQRDESIKSLNWEFSDIKNRFSVFEAYVNLAANILEKIGYFREKEVKSRSRLHDVSHIIYGAYCDVVVSADKKFIKKTKAIYSMLNVPAKVLTLEDFYEF